MRNTKNTFKYNTYISIMIFAFTWVIIGDLVSMHIRLLTDNHDYHTTLPFTKVQKTDKKCLKLIQKQKDKQSGLDFDSFIIETKFNFTINYIGIVTLPIADVIVPNFIFPTNFLRGPPLV